MKSEVAYSGISSDNTRGAEDQSPRTAAGSFSTIDSHSGKAFTCSLEKGYFC
jgi:hypothetical protein